MITQPQADQAMLDAERHVLRAEFQQAMEAFARARLFFHKTGDRDGEAIAMLRTGELELGQGHTLRARDALFEALALFTEEAEDSDCSAAEVLLSEALHLDGESDKAMRHAEAALARAEKAGNLYGEARAYMQMGRIDLDAGRSDLALERLGHARRLYEEAGNGLHEATALSAMAGVLRDTGRPDAAHEALEQAADLYAMNGDHLDEATTRMDIGRLLATLGARDDAREAFSVAARLNGEAGHLAGEAEALLEAGRLEAREAPKRALKLLRHAADLFGHAGLDVRRAQAEREAAGLRA
ncbi:tetratricopeptide repeat protein [Roseospira marina]|uniref:Tetratricopeptide repeat protein n=1 Tax=Roseospira marina TaxID=140057 RepID=A0A5M6ICS4_9PROT|nr:tetratricopeptide repeat protein [Roseospira marina]KAA5605777.1 tetratricopeptide repeat protein [Roseospira marina]MBB4313586.1 tetratricopeptide (TPR) repeat protein [Roseospira marina]MBB5086748.1 tetratricopeptide (TPR) repeat protein [Roseospira marina]